MKFKFSKVLVWTVILLNVIFTTAVLAIFSHVGTEPSTLIMSWFGFTSSELIATAVIKVKKGK